jgi:hypothetical protein
MIIWLASYPKSGNTWMRALVSNIIFPKTNKNINTFEKIYKINSYPQLKHYEGIINKYDDKQSRIEKTYQNWDITQTKINLSNSLRIFKTHNFATQLIKDNKKYQFTNLENSIGVIHIVRDPRNVITSLTHHFTKTYEEAFEMMADKNSIIAANDKSHVPEFLSSWDIHYKSWSSFPKNYLLIRYEDLLSDSKTHINRIVKYLSKFYIIKDVDIENIAEQTNFNSLKKLEKNQDFKESVADKKTNNKKKFFNLGPKNDWRILLSYEMRKKIEDKFGSTMKTLGYL